METIILEKTSEIRNNLPELKEKLKVDITLSGRKLTFSGTPLDEYEARQVFEAIEAGFSAKKALLLTDPENVLRVLHIRDFTRRKNLKDVRARLIGTEGKTKHTLENISNCDISIKESTISIIGRADSIDYIVTAIKNIIRGTKQSNAYSFLEKINTQKRKNLY